MPIRFIIDKRDEGSRILAINCFLLEKASYYNKVIYLTDEINKEELSYPIHSEFKTEIITKDLFKYLTEKLSNNNSDGYLEIKSIESNSESNSEDDLLKNKLIIKNLRFKEIEIYMNESTYQTLPNFKKNYNITIKKLKNSSIGGGKNNLKSVNYKISFLSNIEEFEDILNIVFPPEQQYFVQLYNKSNAPVEVKQDITYLNNLNFIINQIEKISEDDTDSELIEIYEELTIDINSNDQNRIKNFEKIEYKRFEMENIFSVSLIDNWINYPIINFQSDNYQLLCLFKNEKSYIFEVTS
ncbi:uncharacterized protein KGF55_005165 [Candida pseudojiufengensis]|uniref:uncharacterized protein n=1 Tax=Candida pseudojiufengensis TaxID=497109 RepID=UPI0022253695|nr:uncharacterized protein KGF55_005165 [Candida pseudojiufengensis]KAI5959933.1 hypothetical protein KGF55_005165 [Candida pseudojiufengensis]